MSELSLREKFICLVSNQEPRVADVIIVLEGDNYERCREAAKLYAKALAPLIVLSGGLDNPNTGSIPSWNMRIPLQRTGVPKDRILTEIRSQNTRGQALNIIGLANMMGWKSGLLVASHYHQYRAFLTFLKAIEEYGMSNFVLINAPARDISWNIDDGIGKRSDLLEQEFEKIEKYRDHVASYEQGIEYLLGLPK